jgi:hypothetical protein
MSESLVVCFRFSDLKAEAEAHFAAARELVEQALARGAEPIGTGIELYAFELSSDAIEDAIEFALAVATPRSSGAALAVGISEGVVSRSDAVAEKLPLVWGAPLVSSALLACVAAPGEVLVDAALTAARAGKLLAHGARTAAQGGVHVHGLVLDKAEPWTARGRASHPASPPASPRPALDSAHDIDLLSSVPPPKAPAPATATAALRTGDAEAVDRLADARVAQGRPELADRLHAMAHLARGQTADAIRRLELSAEAARRHGSPDRCRASLALAVALSAAGRHEEALFEALDALARARETNDMRGEHATLRFLSKLAGNVGQVDVAAGWAVLAEG